MVVQSQFNAHGQRNGRLRYASIPRERFAPRFIHFQIGMRRRRQRTASGRSAGFVTIKLRHKNIVAILPVRRKPHQPRMVSRGSDRFLLLQRFGHLRKYWQSRSFTGLETGQV